MVFLNITRIIPYLAASIILACTNANQPEAANQSEATEISFFYYEWDTTSRFMLSPDWVEKQSDFNLEIQQSKDIAELKNIIGDDDAFVLPMNISEMNGRLLIKISSESGHKTYFADQFKICNLEISRCKLNSDKFKSAIKGFAVHLDVLK